MFLRLALPLILSLGSWLFAADEVLTLTDGRVLVGSYDEAAATVTMRDADGVARIPVKPDQIDSRRAATQADLEAQATKRVKNAAPEDRLRLLKSVLSAEQKRLTAMEKAAGLKAVARPGGAPAPTGTSGELAKLQKRVAELQTQVADLEVEVKASADAAAELRRKAEAEVKAKAKAVADAKAAAAKWKAQGLIFDPSQLTAEEIEAEGRAVLAKREQDLIDAEQARQAKLLALEKRHQQEEDRRVADATAIRSAIENRRQGEAAAAKEAEQRALIRDGITWGVMIIIWLISPIAAITRQHHRRGAILGTTAGSFVLMAAGWFLGGALIQGVGTILGVGLLVLAGIWTFAPQLLEGTAAE